MPTWWILQAKLIYRFWQSDKNLLLVKNGISTMSPFSFFRHEIDREFILRYCPRYPNHTSVALRSLTVTLLVFSIASNSVANHYTLFLLSSLPLRTRHLYDFIGRLAPICALDLFDKAQSRRSKLFAGLYWSASIERESSSVRNHQTA